MNHQSQGWLAISTEGFAAMNAARPPEHLIKELVQNSLDSFTAAQAGEIHLRYGHTGGSFHISCDDNGSGIAELEDLRVVYLTHKTDSHLKRGRFGRGFKELLCIAEHALVSSGGRQLEFLQEHGQRISRLSDGAAPMGGTSVRMRLGWPAEVAGQLDRYFQSFLLPEGVRLLVNGTALPQRPRELRIEASLTTELYDTAGQCWRKPSRRTCIALVRTLPGETPTIYEMGIPVAAVEWDAPFHCDVQQRVPMNPNRDAVAAGYPLKLHVACLPALLAQMEGEMVRQDWVGNAGRRCVPAVQKQIIERAFGDNIARSVPKMGSRQFDEDARELGVAIVNTAQTSGGFRDMLKAHVPSAREVVQHDEQVKAEVARDGAFPAGAPLPQSDERQQWIERRGGREHVQRCLAFAVWFCQQLVDTCPSRQAPVSGQLMVGPRADGSLYAHWDNNNVLTLALDQPCFWRAPLGPDTLETLIHEAAHAMNLHHGRDFRKEMERLAGIAASLMLHRGEEIRRRFPQLLPV
ncbi:MAG: ATP-binding protein [Synechococcaceae cyanobacterium]|nr:ATP-binding protein [Synechococcaceae cyanobacterium]